MSVEKYSPVSPEEKASILDKLKKAVGSKVGRVALAFALIASSAAGINSSKESVPVSGSNNVALDVDAGSSADVAQAKILDVSEQESNAVEQLVTYEQGNTADFDFKNGQVTSYERDFTLEQDDLDSFTASVADFVNSNVDAIRSAIENGQQISVTGFASAEDDTPGGGFTTEDQLNDEGKSNSTLSKDRGLAGAMAFAKQVNEQLGITMTPDQFTEVHGVEDVWTQDQLQEAQDLATQYGFESVESMVDQWNRGPKEHSDFPEDVVNYLNDNIDQERGFTISVPVKDIDSESGIAASQTGSSTRSETSSEAELDLTLVDPSEVSVAVDPITGVATFSHIDGIAPPNVKVVPPGDVELVDEQGKPAVDKRKKPVKTTVYPPPPPPPPHKRISKKDIYNNPDISTTNKPPRHQAFKRNKQPLSGNFHGTGRPSDNRKRGRRSKHVNRKGRG